MEINEEGRHDSEIQDIINLGWYAVSMMNSLMG
jgi:hypothetical protein